MVRIGLATNPTANTGSGAASGRRTVAALERRGATIVDVSGAAWRETLENARSAAAGLDCLVVVGGDGMVHLGVQVCAPIGLPMGIVAAGSGNDFATVAGLPVRDPELAVTRICATLDNPHEVDLGRAVWPDGTERYFAGVLSAGIDAAVAARGRRMRLPRGERKYKAAVALELPRYRAYGVRVEATFDGHKVLALDEPSTLIAVSNSGMLGGGIPMSPDSQLRDGALELVRAEPLTRIGIVKIFPRLLRGTHIGDPRVHVSAVTDVSLAPGSAGAHPPVASADGEELGPLPLTVTIAPRALRLLGATAH